MRLDAALVALVACASPQPPPLTNAAPVRDDVCALPWDPRDMGRRGEVHVLAWKHEVDDRPFNVTSAIVLVVNSGRFELAHLFSFADGVANSWNLSIVTDHRGFLSHQMFDDPPSRQDFDGFLDATQWTFGAENNFRLTAKGVCANEWHKYFGIEPWHHFGEVGDLRSRRDPAP